MLRCKRMLKMIVDVVMVEVRASLCILGYEKQHGWADDCMVLLEAWLRCPVDRSE